MDPTEFKKFAEKHKLYKSLNVMTCNLCWPLFLVIVANESFGCDPRS